MKGIKLTREHGRRNIDTSGYDDYLASIRDSLPAGAREFAESPWHYDFRDERCPHDANLLEMVLSGPPLPEVRTNQSAGSLVIRLAGNCRTGVLRFVYTGLRGFRLEGIGADAGELSYSDVLVDEIGLTSQGHVVHEIAFDDGTLVIECSDVKVEWLPNRPASELPHV